MTPIAALVTMFALARKSLVSVTVLIFAQAGTVGSFTDCKRPSRVALCTSSCAAICDVTLAMDFPSADALLKVASLLRVCSVPAKNPDSIPSMKFATLKFVIALGLKEVCGGGPLGTPPPARSAVALERRLGGGFCAGCAAG
jgi:hypothetical protein